MKLNTRIFGEGKDLIILHGLYGSGDNWLSFARQIPSGFRIHLPDQRNHGNSPHDADQSYQAMVADLKTYIEANTIVSPIIMGHSMGGKTAMWFSVLYPEIISSLIVLDISPLGYAQLTSRSTLIDSHLNILNAIRNIDLNAARTRNEIDRELSEYIPSDKIRQFLLKSIERNKGGLYSWKLNIDAIANYLPEILNGINIEKYTDQVNTQMPVLFIRGEMSEYIPEEHFEAIKTLYPQAVIQTIFDAGHWIHADQPSALLAVLKNFLG